MTTKVMLWAGDEQSALNYLDLEKQAQQMLVNDPDLKNRFSGAAMAQDSEEERFGPYSEMIQVYNNVAVLSINGSMYHRETWITRIFGITTYEGIANAIEAIKADGNIDTVILNIDSPGGAAKGIDTASDAIAEAIDGGMNVIAHTGGAMCSAAYWIGCAAQEVLASQSAEVGSIGVIAIHAEVSEQMKDEGINVTVLRKGEEKALATPYEKLTDEARNSILESMERSYTSFIDHVSACREMSNGYVRSNIATGRVFGADGAVQIGLIDYVKPFKECVAGLIDKSSSSPSNVTSPEQWRNAAMATSKMKPTLSPEEAALAVAAGADPNSLTVRSQESADDESAQVVYTEATEEEEAEDDGQEDLAATTRQTGHLSQIISDLNGQLVDERCENRTLRSRVTELESGNAGLRQIAIEQTQRLRVNLGQPGSAEDLKKMSDASLIDAHRHILGMFMERFSAGAVSQESEDDPTPVEATTRLTSAVQRLTRIK